MKRRRPDVIFGKPITAIFAWRNWGKPQKPSVRTAGVRAEILTRIPSVSIVVVGAIK